MAYNEQLTSNMQIALEQPFTLEEIKIAIFDANGRKSPGPDGVSFAFYQIYWEIIKDDIFQLVQSFANNTLELSKLNHTSIVLIPNTSESTIHQYRPISLINYSYKIISKVLANRLATIMNYLINYSQTIFIKGRSIFDNIISAQEIFFK
jgi:Reverse transcriptase (RNA-dependent DNA polymerase)